jgi:hypothetical protein
MAHTWKYAVGLGLVGAALSVACTVSSGDDDTGTGAQGGESSGGTSGKGGSSGSGATGGTGGSTGGAGGSTGGTGGTTSGSGGSTAGEAGAGTGGSTGGTGGATGGATGGTGGATGGTGGNPTPTCDPLPDTTTPWADCEPSPGFENDACAQCQKKSCCDLVKSCRSYNPYNVCSWGGPLPGEDYSGAGEIGCMLTCMTDYVATNEVCDSEGIDYCTGQCTTKMCGIPGDDTSKLFGCIKDNCPKDCFSTDKVTIDSCG